MTKYKYYFRKPKSEIIKDTLYWLVMAGAVTISATSPYFGVNLIREVKRFRKYKKRKVADAFQRLRKQGCINIEKINHQIYIHLTKEGRKMAGWMQIDALTIKKPKIWDRNWRLVIFDIAQLKKFYRDALRGKLKEFGFLQLQKSVWIHPFDCRDEIEFLREFFGLSEKEMRLIVSHSIGEDDWLKKLFHL